MFNDSLDRLTAYAALRPQGGVSVFDPNAIISLETIEKFLSTDDDRRMAVDELQEMGFEVGMVGPLSVQISGPATLFRERIGVEFAPLGLYGVGPTDQLLAPVWLPIPTSQVSENLLDTGIPGVDGIVFPEPMTLAAPMPQPPELPYHHLRVPEDITRILNADPVHNEGVYGQNVWVAMIDSGFQWWAHSYFTSKGYDLEVSSLDDSGQDIVGHGTGESANLLAVAPGVKLYGLGMQRFDPIPGLNDARDTLGVQIISCSWVTGRPTDVPGASRATMTDFQKQLEREIVLCIAQGIIVLVAAGNFGRRSFTASMPDTISVGGVYVDEQGNMRASDIASSFDSALYPNQHVPEVCGLVGETRTNDKYIALPVPPGCAYDISLGGGSFPDKDETGLSDGWAVFSGTSAACPQVAGAVALILSKYPGVDLDEVRERLHRCQDVTGGQSYMGELAGSGYDAATGYGLVDIEQACE